MQHKKRILVKSSVTTEEEIKRFILAKKAIAKKTFKKAIADDMPRGGYLDRPYDEWVASIIG